jgi:protein TonB
VKRLLTAFFIALAIHLLALSLVFKRFSVDRFELNQDPPVTMTFTYREPVEKPANKRPPPPVVQPPKKIREPAPKKIKPQKRPFAKSVKPEEPIIPPVVEPQPVPLDPKQPPETEEQSTTAVVDDRPMAPPVKPTTDANPAIDSPTATKRSTAPPIRKARPLYRQNPPPRYPRAARHRGQEGSVMLEVKVLKDGTVGDMRLLSSSGYTALDKAAIKSVRKWLFEPGMQGDQEVDMWVRVPIRFKIE